MALGTLIAGLPFGAGLAAQPPRVVSDQSLCRTCQLTLEHVVAVGRLSDSELIASWPSVVRDARGRFLVAGAIPPTRILVYDTSGRLLTTWGREGDGPGEFRSIGRLVRLPGDSLLVLEGGARRATVLDAAGQFSRRFVLPFDVVDFTVLTNGQWIASGMAFTTSGVGFPLHRLTRDGAIESSFGGDLTVLPGRPSAVQRVITRDHEGGFWAARPDRYEIEHWTATSGRDTYLDRITSWFPDREFEGARNTWRDPPYPFLHALYVDAGGRVWTLGRAPKPSFKPTPKAWGPLSTMSMAEEAFVEVIDPVTGVLLATRRFPWIGVAFTDQGLIVSFRYDDDGVMVVDLWRGILKGGGT
jgi:hypothetical protein